MTAAVSGNSQHMCLPIVAKFQTRRGYVIWPTRPGCDESEVVKEVWRHSQELVRLIRGI